MPIRSKVIERTLPFEVGAQGGDGLTLSGHAAVFGQKTEIDSWEGTFLESIRAGAFAKTLRERTPVMQFDHGRHPLVGSIPIGAFSQGFPREDDMGLAVEARMLDNWLIQPVRDAIANQTINGMSFRFEVVRDLWKDKAGKELSPVEVDQLLWKPGTRGPLTRELIELKMPECGPVVFPAYEGTDVSVRARQVAYEIRSAPAMVHQVRALLATDSPDGASIVEDPAMASDVARALLFDLPDHATRQLERVRSHFAARAVTVADQAALASLLAQVAAADAQLDPLCEALCAADDALDSATMLISEMLGVDNPDPEEDPMAGMPANSAAPRDAHPANTQDAPPVVAPVDPVQARAAFMRRAYITREGVGGLGGYDASTERSH